MCTQRHGYVHVSVGAHRVQKELELKVVVSYSMWLLESNSGLRKQYTLILAEPSFQPHILNL